MTKGIIFLIVLTAVVTVCCALYVRSLDKPADSNAFLVERGIFYENVEQGI